MYENQNLLCIVPLVRHSTVVCISNISLMTIGCFICVNINLVIVLIDTSNFVMSGSILFKILADPNGTSMTSTYCLYTVLRYC